MKNRFLAIGVTALVAVGSVFTAFGLMNGAQAAEQVECGDNSIIKCGAMSSADLKAKYAANDGDLQAIYSHYGITADDIAGSTGVKTGLINPDGTVTVDGTVIATGAETTGRSADLGGSAVKINGTTTVYQGADRLSSPLSAYIFMANGQFKAAIIKVCGNPVVATPKPVEQPKPATAACKEIQRQVISRTESNYTAVATVENGATIQSYDFVFTDDKGATVKSVTVTTTDTSAKTGTVALEAGTYTLKVVVNTSVGDKTSENCTLAITIEPAPVVDKDISVCRLSDKTWMTVKESEYTANKSKYSIDKADCKAKPVVVMKDVCVLATGEWKQVKESEYNASKDQYSTDKNDCTTKKVCVLETKKWQDVTVNELNRNPTKYSDKQADCETPKPVVVMKDVCRLSDKTWMQVSETDFKNAKAGTYSEKRDDCKILGETVVVEKPVVKVVEKPVVKVVEKPVTQVVEKTVEKGAPVQNIASTGPAEAAMSFAGLSSLAGAGYYYRTSRRALKNKLTSALKNR